MTEQWYSIVEYARTFSVSDMTVRRRIKTGKLKAVLKDGKYYIPVSKDASHIAALQSQMESEEDFSADEGGGQRSHHSNSGLQLMKGNVNRPASSHINGNLFVGTPKSEISSPPLEQFTKISSAGPIANMINPVNSAANSHEILGLYRDMLDKFGAAEKTLSDKYSNKISALEALIAKKDLEIRSLKQQVEDLQLLVKIFEKKNP